MAKKKSKVLIEAQQAYQKGEPIMSDEMYDILSDGEEDLGDYEGGKVKHDVPMLSQGKCHDIKDVLDFCVKTNDCKYSVSLKLDGFACSLLYQNGKLVLGSTRGNGEYGEDITKTIKAYVSQYPSELPQPINAEIRGEIVCIPQENETLDDQNFRNIAVGICKRKEIIPETRVLKFYAWDVVCPLMDYELDKRKWLESMNFVPVMGCVVDPCDVEKTVREIEDNYKCARIPADGIVVKCNSKRLQDKLGNTAHHPKSSIAYKFGQLGVVTTVKRIEISVGKKTGKRTPIAHIEPVVLGGAKVAKVSLGSESVMNEMGIAEGKKVIVKRSGGVIPHIIGVVE